MTEPEAFRAVQRASMDQRRSMRAVAQDVLDGRLEGVLTAVDPVGNAPE